MSKRQEVVGEGGIWNTWKMIHDAIFERHQGQQTATVDAQPQGSNYFFEKDWKATLLHICLVWENRNIRNIN